MKAKVTVNVKHEGNGITLFAKHIDGRMFVRFFSIDEYIDFTASDTLETNVRSVLKRYWKRAPKKITITTPYIFGTKNDNS